MKSPRSDTVADGVREVANALGSSEIHRRWVMHVDMRSEARERHNDKRVEGCERINRTRPGKKAVLR